MTEMDRVSTRDLEQLSAYLDGELGERDAQKIRARLEADPALRGALEELRGTAAVLEDLPQQRPPRSFTLTEEMVGDRRRTYPLLQFSAALAAISFMLLVGADVAIRGTIGDPQAVNLAREAFFEPEVPEGQPLDLENMPAAPIAESEGLAAAGESEEPSVAAEFDGLAATAESEGDAAVELAEEDRTQALAPAEEPAETALPPQSEVLEDYSKVTEDELEPSLESSAPADDRTQESQGRDPDAQDQLFGFQADQLGADQLPPKQAPREDRSSLLLTLRVGEVLLAAIALTLVGLTLWVRRS